MDVSIVIRTKNEGEFVNETLKRVVEQEFGGSYEIIIVDSGSTDSTLDIVKKYNVKLLQISEKEFTYGRSLNVGAMGALGEFVVNLSAHALPVDEKWLMHLISGFDDNRTVGVYGRQLTVGRLNPFEAFRNDQFFGDQKLKFNMNDKRAVRRVHFSNGNSAIKKDIWQRFKFNEEARYAEDVIWQTDVMKAGFSISYCPDAAVYHSHRVNLYDVYRCSRDCSHSLAVMKMKRQSIPGIMWDLGMVLAFVPNAIFQNVRYVLAGRYLQHLMIAPFYVLSGWLGWFVGRAEYRLQRS